MGGVSGLVVVIGWLAFQHIPAWYDPPQVTHADTARIRATLPAAYQTFSDLLAAGGTFEYKLAARTVNEWIAARASLWPDARDAVPKWLREPVIAFANDRVIIAARFDSGGWRAIVSAHLDFVPGEDDVMIRIAKVAAGSLPVPPRWVARTIDQYLAEAEIADSLTGDIPESLGEALRRPDSAAALSSGVKVPNRWHWSNGDRRFRILDLRAEDGLLTLTVEVL